MLEELRQEYIDGIFKSGAFLVREKPFTLRCGKKSNFFIDHRRFLTKRKHLHLITNIFLLLLRDKVEDVTFVAVESTMSPVIASALSTMLGKDLLIINERTLTFGTQERIFGEIVAGKEYVIVDDIVTAGLLVEDAAKMIRQKGGVVKYALSCVTRSTQTVSFLKQLDISLLYISDVEQILTSLKPTLTPSQQEILEKESLESSNCFTLRMELSYEERLQYVKNQVMRNLIKIMQEKKSNLILAVDVTSTKQALHIIKEAAPHIIGVKTHIDILDDFSFEFILELKELAKKHNFIIFEDRKFAEIGNTAKLQYAHGLYHILDWADIVNAHALPGQGVIHGLSAAMREYKDPRAALIIAQMSSKDNLATTNYSLSSIEIAEMFPDYVIGFVATGGDPQKLRTFAEITHPGYFIFTPGIRIGAKADTIQQTYGIPHDAINSGSDILIVGRGIYLSEDIAQKAEEYKEVGWNAYLSRMKTETN